MPPAAAAAAAEESESQPLTGQSAGAEPAPATPLPQPEKLQPDGLPDMSDEDEVDERAQTETIVKEKPDRQFERSWHSRKSGLSV